MLITEIQDEILLIKINRPEKRNAMNDELVLAIEHVFSNIPAGVKCAIIHAEGKHFSAGLDLSELKERNIVEGLHHSRMWHRALEKVQFGTLDLALEPSTIGLNKSWNLNIICLVNLRRDNRL